MPPRAKTGTSRADLNEIKEVITLEVQLAITKAVEPLAAQIRTNTQTLYGVNGNNGLRGDVSDIKSQFGGLRDEFKEEKNKLKGAAAVLSAIGAAVGVASSFAARALFK